MRGGRARGRVLARAAGALSVIAAGALRAPLPAQQPVSPPPTPTPGPDVRPTGPRPAPVEGARGRGGARLVACRGQRVSDVVVLSQPPLGSALLGRYRWVRGLQRTATSLHSVTRESIVRRFLLLNPGDACDELRRSESERILRAQPYLVDARVRAYDDGAGGVRLEVETRDEFSVIVGVAAFAGADVAPVSVVRLGEANLMGRGVYAVGQWADGGRGYHDGYVARVTHYQLFGRPYQLALLGERRDVGQQWAADASHPFYTDLQRVAWRVAGGASRDVLEMVRSVPDGNAVFYRRSFANAGGILRVGTPGRLSLFGTSVSYEESATSDDVRVLSDSGVVADVGPPLGFLPADRFPKQRVIRANALWGVRAVNFLRVAGFDALTGVQDVRRGFQAGVVLGRSVNALGSRDDDYYAHADAYGGAGTPQRFAALELRGEARHDNRRNEWRGLVTGGRLAGYAVPEDSRWRFVLSGEYSGVWRPRVPVQLALGARDGGLRGYLGAREAGAGRAIVRAESRLVLGRVGRVGDFGDLGLSGFAEAGKLWAGDAPYGVDSPVRASVGVGVLGAFPRASRRLWRVDVARPLTRVPGAPAVQVAFENRDLTRLFWREPRDVQLGRERTVPRSLFSWP